MDLVTHLLEADPGFGRRELGDLHDKESYDYILSYAPYDNIEAKAYPHLLVTAGYEDFQAQYWQPAKWVAKLRAHNTGQTSILLKTQMEAGHAGASGRYEEIQDTALRYAWLLSRSKTAAVDEIWKESEIHWTRGELILDRMTVPLEVRIGERGQLGSCCLALELLSGRILER